MTGRTVISQAELDAALAEKADRIVIDSPAGVWLKLSANGSSSVVAYGSSSVVACESSSVVACESSSVEACESSSVVAYGSSRVVAYESSSVEAYGSSSVVAYGSSSVEAYGSSSVVAYGSSSVVAYESSRVVAYGSSRVVAYESSSVVACESSSVEACESSSVVAYGSSRVVAYESSSVVAYGSSSVVAYGSSRVVAGKYVAVHLFSQRVTLSGGVLIDMTAVDASKTEDWIALMGVKCEGENAILYKALDAEFCAGHRYTQTSYAVGSTVTCADWIANGDCGHGLHLSPRPAMARRYREDAQHYVAVSVAIADINVVGPDKCKVPKCRVLYEVDIHGDKIEVRA